MRFEQATVTVKIGEKELSQGYQKQVADLEDLRAMVNGEDLEKQKYAVDRYNYAHDLAMRNKVRAQIVAQEAGPDNAVAKLVAQITKQRAAVGKPVSEEEALAIAKQILGV